MNGVAGGMEVVEGFVGVAVGIYKEKEGWWLADAGNTGGWGEEAETEMESIVGYHVIRPEEQSRSERCGTSLSHLLFSPKSSPLLTPQQISSRIRITIASTRNKTWPLDVAQELKAYNRDGVYQEHGDSLSIG
ncbi:hypothetical protein ACET3Z_004956 [Daucus carota]